MFNIKFELYKTEFVELKTRFQFDHISILWYKNQLHLWHDNLENIWIKIIRKILSLLKCQKLISWKSHCYSKISLLQGRLSTKRTRNIFAIKVVTLKNATYFRCNTEYLWMCRKERDIEIPTTDLSPLTFNREMWHTDIARYRCI